jgi:uncharacterized protein YgiB involved in biofilm formation
MRKSSARVTLALIGVAALAGCGEEQRRDVYATREDCLADWGNKVADCNPATEPRHSSRGYWYGPVHSSSSGWSSRSASRSIGSSGSGSRGSVSRGGFGSSAHSSGG